MPTIKALRIVAPVRERGLKFGGVGNAKDAGLGRSRKGAWIEIGILTNGSPSGGVAPVRERGLKYQVTPSGILWRSVAPVRERGLK